MENKILFVDDESNVLMALKRELMDETLSATFAQTPDEAFGVLDRESFKIVVADVKMAQTTGFEVLEKAKTRDPKVVRMVLSGHPDVQLILGEVNRLAIDRYIVKPWDSEVLKMLLRQGILLYDMRIKFSCLESECN